MKVFITDSTLELKERMSSFTLVDDFDEADTVLVMPGGLAAIYLLLRGIDEKKDIYLFNKKHAFNDILRGLIKQYEEGRKSQLPNEYMTIEDDLGEIIRKMEEKKNEELNNGKTSKLL